jgi:ATP-binding cassette subfamily G (WHITE) protein 2 (SNQ2)
MSSVKRLSEHMAVICTIHQPSNEIVHLFDWLLLLQPGGEVVYFGPVTELVAYLVDNKVAAAPEDPDSPDLNVADFALNAIRAAVATKGKAGELDLAKLFKASQRYKDIEKELQDNSLGMKQGHDQKTQPDDPAELEKGQSLTPEGRPTGQKTPAAGLEADDNKRYAGFLLQLTLLTQRGFLNTWRNKLTIQTRVVTAVSLGFVCGTLFWHLGWSQDDASFRVSAIFIGVILPMFLSSSDLASVFAVRPLYFRESNSRMYSAGSWFLARRLADLPYYAAEMFVFGSMLYWISWLRHDDHGAYYFWFLFTLLGIRAAGSTFTQFIATFVATPEVAAALQSTLFTIFFLFAGFLIAEPQIATTWIWMYYISFIRYPLDFLLANEFSDVVFDCIPLSSTACAITDGNQVLDAFGVKYNLGNRAINFVSLWLFYGGFLVFGFLSLKYRNHIKR